MRKCLQCSGSITHGPANKLYCSIDCRSKYTLSRVCKNTSCATEFIASDRRQKYCSRSCAAVVNNTNHPKRVRISGVFHCLVCDKKLKDQQKRFCSKYCATVYRTYKKYSDFIEGFSDGSTITGLLGGGYRLLLLENCDYTCRCGWNTPNPVTGKPILTINHIDGDWKNNYIWNLEVLCYNCHTLTPTFGALNVGSPSGRRNYQFER